MPATLALEVVTPERLLLRLRVAYVYAHGEAGDFCVLPRHMPLLTVLRVGSLHYRLDGKVHFVFVRGGIFTVCRDAALVLAEVAELPMEIDVDRAQKARERALARLESDRSWLRQTARQA